MSELRAKAAVVRALSVRALNEVLRVPGAAVPGILAPTMFLLGLTAVFGKLTDLTGFGTDSYITFIIAISLLQSAGFSGAATGVNLARDIEHGWFDRLLAAPPSRGVLLTGLVLSASLRVLMPASVVLIVGLALGVHFPGIDGLLLTLVIIMVFAAVGAGWATTIALKFRTQSAAPLMQASMFIAVLFTSSYAPVELLTGALQEIARVNPVTQVVEAVRQGFVGDVTWGGTWPGLLALLGLLVLVMSLALRGMRRATA